MHLIEDSLDFSRESSLFTLENCFFNESSMKLVKKNYSYLITLLLVFCSCNSKNENAYSYEELILSQAKGQDEIVKDNVEYFFENIQLKDIELQTQKEFHHLDAAKEEYKKHIQRSVQDFSENERELIFKVWNKVKDITQEIVPSKFLDSIRLIKIEPNHFGKNVFYTRGKNIIIPSNRLDDFYEKGFLETMLHEVFHIYSRYHPNIRKKLYERIHFTQSPFGMESPKINIPINMVKNTLLNPDGLEEGWFINCSTPSGQKWLAPFLQYKKPEKGKRYFDHLDLRFYEPELINNEIHIQEELYYRIDQIPDLYQKITRNTDYIRHPDEILAENFVLVALSFQNLNLLDSLESDGRKLVLDIGEILQKEMLHE